MAFRSMSLIALLAAFVFGIAAGDTATKAYMDLSNPDEISANIKLVESERLEEYHKRNYSWPIPEYVPNTEGWRALMEKRLAQVAEIEGTGERYEGYVQAIRTAHLVPNFTEHGFGLARCPEELFQELMNGIHGGLDSVEYEVSTKVIEGPRPLFINRPDLTERVLSELHPYVEEWSGMKLTPYRAYGFRLYRNESQLWMHVDKSQTHIISFILHIDSSEDAEPWPIFIEDFQGRTHEVVLTPGDMLFYESSKCFHGRPAPFKGSWYTSVFTHYYPAEGWYHKNHALESHFAVPPSWSEPPPVARQYTPMQMVGTSMREPECPNQWCATVENTVKWSGPGEDGYWIAPTGEKHPFHPKSIHDEL